MGKLRQTTAKIQELLDKVESGEAGGGGLKYSEERTLYGVEEEEMTDEQKAYNAETYSKMWSGEAVTINVGGLLLTPYFAHEDVGFVRLKISFDADGIKVQVIIKLFSDGNVEVSDTFGAEDALVITYGDPESAKAVFADPMFYYKRIVLLEFLVLADLNIKTLPLTTAGKTTCILGAQLEGALWLLTYDVNTGEIIKEEAAYDTLEVYIKVSNTEANYASYNRDAVSGKVTYTNLCVRDNYNSSVVYNPLYSTKTTNEYIEVAIYRDGALEKWRINADGTSTLTA